MRIYYTTINYGDGSSGVGFYDSQECIDFLEEHEPEVYASGEGGDSFEVDGTVQGIYIKSFQTVVKEFNGDFGN